MNENELLQILPTLNMDILRVIADILRVHRGKKVKGGNYKELKEKELLKNIRRGIAMNISHRGREKEMGYISDVIDNMRFLGEREK